MTWSPDSLDWRPQAPRLRPVRLVAAWLVSALALLCAAQLLPGVAIDGFWGALAVAAAIAVLNAFLPAADRGAAPARDADHRPAAAVALDALMLQWAADASPTDAISVDSLLVGAADVALVAAAFSRRPVDAVRASNDDDTYTLRVTQRIARRPGERDAHATRRASSSSRSTGSRCRCCSRAMRDGNAPTMARWLAERLAPLLEWETDLSSQTGASQAGILLGSNDGHPRVPLGREGDGTLMTCSARTTAPRSSAATSTGEGLLIDGGASRGNLLSGRGRRRDPHRQPHRGREAARTRATARSSPTASTSRACSSLFCLGGRASSWSRPPGSERRDVRPRGHRGGTLPVPARRDVRRRARPDRTTACSPT